MPHLAANSTLSARHRPRLLLLAATAALVAATWLAYAPALSAGFVWDDDTFLWNDPHIVAHDSPAHFWMPPGPDPPPDYFPLTSTMLWVEWHWLWGPAPAGYHAVNVALHTISALLLWAVLRRLGLTATWAWVGAMLFALHPVNVESVAWITERKNTLPLPLLLASIWCWLRAQEGRPAEGTAGRDAVANLSVPSRSGPFHPPFGAAAMVLFTLSLLAKTAGVLLPVVMLAILGGRRRRVTWRDVGRVAPFLGVAVALGAITAWYQRVYAIGSIVVRDDSPLSRLAIAGRAVWFYLGKAAWPASLSFIYPRWPAAETGRWVTWLPLAALAGLALGLWLLRRHAWSRAAALALGVYLAMLLPVLGFIDIFFMRYSLVADHWQYFAIPAPVALLAAGAQALTPRGVATRRALVVIFTAVLIALGTLTFRQSSNYRDLETLWHATMRANPDAWLPYNNLGGHLLLTGRARESIPLFEKAVALDPQQTESLNNLGSAYHAAGDDTRALKQYLAALELAPANVKVLSNIGACHVEAGRFEEALPYLTRAAHLSPNHPRVQYNLGVALLGMQRWHEAEARFRRAVALEPGNGEARNNLGATLMGQGRLEEAQVELRESLRLDPNNTQAQANLAAVKQKLKGGTPDERR